MPFEDLEHPTAVEVPQAKGPVLGTREQLSAVGAHRQGLHDPGVCFECPRHRSGLDVQHDDRPVTRAKQDVPAVGCEHNRVELMRTPLVDHFLLARLEVPDARSAVV